MKDLVIEVLKAGGNCDTVDDTTTRIISEDVDVMEQMESWLGLNNNNDNNNMTMTMTTTIEDCVPLSPETYIAFSKLFEYAWNEDAQKSSSTTLLMATTKHSNRLIESNLSPETISLNQVFDCIRVTQWLRQLMEYNLSSNEDEDDDSSSSISVLLLSNNDNNNNNDDNNNNTNSLSLYKALFAHLRELPNIQSQLYAYINYLQRSKSLSLPIVNNDPTARLQQYERAQQTSRRLIQEEWNQHLERLYDILLEWYRVGNVTQRKYMRQLLGTYWKQFIQQQEMAPNAMYSSGLKKENTSAAAMKITLLVLHKILLGMDTNITTNTTTTTTSSSSSSSSCSSSSSNRGNPVLEHLLVTYLIPLHKADGLVLWRDQMALLELYHEPLTQCCAIILQYLPKNHIPTTITALLSSTIFPTVGNTPKQVLLLHELDTYITLLSQKNTNITNDSDNSLEQQQYQQQYQRDVYFMMKTLLSVLSHCMSSDHSRVAERALQFFKNTQFKLLLSQNDHHHTATYLRILLPALVRREPSWNPTVRKMTYTVLQQMQTMNQDIFAQVSNDLFSQDEVAVDVVVVSSSLSSSTTTTTTTIEPRKKGIFEQEEESAIEKNTAPSTTPSQFSLKAGMGSWRPPPSQQQQQPQQHSSMPPPMSRQQQQQRRRQPGAPIGKGTAPWAYPPSQQQQQPPSTVTGVAPWATSSNNNNKKQPPVTVTGVAPWATTNNKSFVQQQPPPPPVTVTGVAPWANSKTPQQPPVTVTGVAPWANPKTSQQPPVTVTGVAPWAMKPKLPKLPPTPPPSSSNRVVLPNAKQPSTVATAPHKRRAQEAHLQGITEGEQGSDDDDDDHDDDEDENDEQDNNNNNNNDDDVVDMDTTNTTTTTTTTVTTVGSGLERVLTLMAQLKPPEEDGDGVSSWSRAQMAKTPTYLPELKFHDLVFGHDLGHGAFGSVRYARLIDKTKSRSQWAEYAVKIVSTEKIRALGYEASIQREIATLRVLSHPGIARLVSSFRFREGAYLVLEYASRGDVHSLLQKHGSLDNDSTRFVMGEIIAALASIHEMGFVYGDLKPENMVITETGHIKLTDFGGCRPVTEDAKTLLRSVATGILKNLRDGDWKPQKHKAPKRKVEKERSQDDMFMSYSDDEEEDEDDDEFQEYYEEAGEDLRVEGTTAYLPPEVVMGAVPTFAADTWALGCVMYQCLSGRPPILEADDEATKHRIVSFDVGNTGDSTTNAASSEIDRLFQDKHAQDITTEARSLISSMLERDSSKRPGMDRIAEHDFFASVNVFSLYSEPAYPLDVGNVAPTPDAKWSRRQFSSIWSPQPVAYDISLAKDNKNSGANSSSSFGASRDSLILEGDEKDGFFSPTGKMTAAATGSKSERKMLLPPS